MAFVRSLWTLLVSLMALGGVWTQTAHTQCNFVEDNLFTCDYSALTTASDRPIDYTSFSPVPQRLDVTMNGLIPFYGDTQVFSTSFSGIDTSTFIPNYPASMTVDCGRSGSLYLYSGAFSNMSYVQSFKIRNCRIYEIPAYAFEHFQYMDYFGIESGSIDNIDPNAWTGLIVEKLTSTTSPFPRYLGKFEILYTPFPTAYVPPGLLYNMKNLTSATLRGVGVSQLTSDVFRYNTKIKYIDVSDNVFTKIPSGLFKNLDSLSEFRADNINWECSCSNNWFVPYAISNNISLVGSFVCSSGEGVVYFYYKHCVTNTVCGDMTGFPAGKLCIGPFAFIIFLLSIAAGVMVTIALVIIIMLLRTEKQADTKRRQAIGRWNQILDTAFTSKKSQGK